jgi:TorA maturation chaperone TorD
MNEFSILCRVLGTLYYRQPQDPLLVPLFTLIREGKLAQNWPLEQDDLLERLQKLRHAADCDRLQCAVRRRRVPRFAIPFCLAGRGDGSGSPCFLSTRGMPLSDTPADHIGTLLLAASWIEDHAGDDENEAIETLFETYLLPWVGTFLGKVEAHATPFWRTLAPLTRDAIAAMWDELEEENEE